MAPPCDTVRYSQNEMVVFLLHHLAQGLSHSLTDSVLAFSAILNEKVVIRQWRVQKVVHRFKAAKILFLDPLEPGIRQLAASN